MCRKISVIIPVYQGESRGFLSDAIESVLQQTYENFELLLVNDGSTDRSEKLCKSHLADSRVKYIYQENGGVSCARNNGIAHASGDYICFLDDDDLWLSDKLAKQVAFIESLDDPKFGLCYTALELITQEGRRTGVIQAHHAKKDIFKELLCKNLVDCTSSVLIPKKVFLDVGVFNEALSRAEDYELWLKIAKKYHVYSIAEPLVLYREHKNKLSADLEKMEQATLFVVDAAIKRAGLDTKDYKKKNPLYQTCINAAKQRFWLEDYAAFRSHVKSAKKYCPVGFGMRMRYAISYFPGLIRGVRFLKKFVQRAS